MGKGLVIRLGTEENSFALSKVDRDKIYGKRERVVVDENNQPCSAAWLTSDGTALVPLGGTAHVWVDERWTAHDASSRRAVDPDGNAVAMAPSTLGVAQDAVEVAPLRVLEHVTHSVYELTPESLGDTLRAALAEERIFEAHFSYRESLESDRVFILASGEGIFALVGKPSGFSMLERAAPTPELADGEDEIEGDLDFSML